MTPSPSNFSMCKDELVSLNCSVLANPLPLITWVRLVDNEEEEVIGHQASTWFMEKAYSILTVNSVELGVGNHTFLCKVSVETLAGEAYNDTYAAVSATIFVESSMEYTCPYPSATTSIKRMTTSTNTVYFIPYRNISGNTLH